jgi:hypothetical protein
LLRGVQAIAVANHGRQALTKLLARRAFAHAEAIDAGLIGASAAIVLPLPRQGIAPLRLLTIALDLAPRANAQTSAGNTRLMVANRPHLP